LVNHGDDRGVLLRSKSPAACNLEVGCADWKAAKSLRSQRRQKRRQLRAIGINHAVAWVLLVICEEEFFAGGRRPVAAISRAARRAATVVTGGHEFHGDVGAWLIKAVRALREDGFVMDLAGAWFVAARDVGLRGPVRQGRCFFSSLAMRLPSAICSWKEIVKKFDVGIVDGADEFRSLRREDVRKYLGFFFGVDIFDEELDVVPRGEIAGAFQGFMALACICFLREAGDFVSGLQDQAG